MIPFSANLNIISFLTNWLQSYYSLDKPARTYVILFGDSGNGKTYIVEELAKELHVELYKITTDDLQSTNDLSNIMKSVNTQTLSGTHHKLILVDDIDKFSVRYQTKLIEIASISRYPVIYTSTTFTLPLEFIEGSLKDNTNRLRLRKPLTSELFAYLKTLSSLPDEKLKEIAQQSKSIRSAVLSLQNESVNDETKKELTKGEFLKSIKERKLAEPLTRKNIHSIFKSIRGYDNNAFQVMSRFAEFEYRIYAKYEEIDPIFVNEMIEPIEKISFEYQNKNHTETKKEPEKLSLPKQDKTLQKVETQKKQPTLDKWFTKKG